MSNFDFIQEKFKFPPAQQVDFDFGSGAYKLLAGESNVMTAVWADSTASRTTGKMYVASAGNGAAFSILDLDIKLLYDRYTVTGKGRANEVLQQNDPKDIIIN